MIASGINTLAMTKKEAFKTVDLTADLSLRLYIRQVCDYMNSHYEDEVRSNPYKEIASATLCVPSAELRNDDK